MIDLADPQERSAAAGEYVLGTLAGDDIAAFASAMAADATLRGEVAMWQDRLLGLSARVPAATPRAQLWQRIDVAVHALSAIPPPSKREVPAPPRPWWQALRLWQGLSAAALAASLMLAVLLVQRDAPAARFVAVLQSPDNRTTGWVVEWQAGRGLRLVPAGAAELVPAGRALQFWTKAEGAAGPTSLGLVRAGEALALPLARLQEVGPRQLFEITLEPENGSPIGRPTGPILYLGRAVAL